MVQAVLSNYGRERVNVVTDIAVLSGNGRISGQAGGICDVSLAKHRGALDPIIDDTAGRREG